MKRFFAALFAAFLAFSSHAQIQIGSAEVPVIMSGGALGNNDLDAFKKTTTVFCIQETGVARKADFEKALKGIWTITSFIAVGPDEMDQYADGRKYSQAGFGGFIIQRNSYSGRSGTQTNINYDFAIADYDKGGKQDGRKLIARFLVSP